MPIVKVELHGEVETIEVQENEYILSAALDHDVDIPYSCQGGNCGTCRAKLIEGEVEMDEDDALSNLEKSENYILCCMSRVISDHASIRVE